MPICEYAYPSRPCDVEPLLFAMALQNHWCAIEFFAVPISDCRPVLQKTSDFYCEYCVVFVRRFLEFLLTIFCVYQMHVLWIYPLGAFVSCLLITQKTHKRQVRNLQKARPEFRSWSQKARPEFRSWSQNLKLTGFSCFALTIPKRTWAKTNQQGRCSHTLLLLCGYHYTRARTRTRTPTYTCSYCQRECNRRECNMTTHGMQTLPSKTHTNGASSSEKKNHSYLPSHGGGIKGECNRREWHLKSHIFSC